MARLIDADNLNFEGQNYNKSQMKAILDFIDKQPTAYDVEKVVEALEEQQEYYSFDFDNDLDCAKYKAYKNAIDIVKRGGADGNV